MIILLTGENSFAIKQALDELVAKFLDKVGEHGLEKIDGEIFPAARLGELLQGASLFAAKRLVILRGASQNKELWEALGEWVDRVPSEATLAVVEPTPDKRTKTYKLLQKHARVQEFGLLADRDLLVWLQKTASSFDGRLESKEAGYLLQRVGNDQWRLHYELQKLINYQPSITIENINALVEPSPQATVFELLDAALTKQSGSVRQRLLELKANEDPYRLFGLLVSQIHTLSILRFAPLSKSPAEIAKEAGVHPFVVRKLSAKARSLTKPGLGEIVAGVAKTDERLKSTGIDPWILLEQCLLKIAAA